MTRQPEIRRRQLLAPKAPLLPPAKKMSAEGEPASPVARSTFKLARTERSE